MWLLNKSKIKAGSRRQIQIKEVKDNVLVLPDNQYRMVIETSSINFELKSDEEQDVLIDGFQNFLNALPSELQILVRVRELDLDRYIEQITKTKDHEKEIIYQQQISNYCDFVRQVVSGNKILSRHFYIIVPYHHIDKPDDFDFIKEQLILRKEIVAKGLEKLGMKARTLDSLEILDLFYSFYNSDQAKTQELKGQTIQRLIHNNYA